MLERSNSYGDGLNKEIDAIYKWLNLDPNFQAQEIISSATLTSSQAGLLKGNTTKAALKSMLPSASTYLGLTYICLFEVGANAWTIANPDGTTLCTLSYANDVVVVRSDGNVWKIIALSLKTLTGAILVNPDIDGGTIDNCVIGGTTPAAGTFTTVNATTGNITTNNTTTTKADHIAEKTPAHGVVFDNAVDINSGTIDGCTSPVSGLFVPTGVYLPFGGTVAPAGYLMCDGASYLRADYAALYAVIGNAFGTADGTHFNVPDFRGRFLRGVDHAQARDPNAASRTAMAAGGNTGDNVGSVQTQATKLPTTPFTTGTESATHAHLQRYTPGTGTTLGHVGTATGGSATNEAVYTGNASATHYHTVNGGGDSETRPINAYTEFIIKT